ncbi:MAG: ABC transporter ATP-binding protein [Saprospiraceae bacterium]|nr:ABC transporter ATP-binding protein [Saprospiraceae bacterium]
MIKLQDVTKVYRTDTVETLALNNINLSVEDGEFVSIMGPSGCGKSTLLNMMGLLDRPSDGQVTIDEKELKGYKEKALAKFRNEHLGFIFQSFHLIGDLPVVDNVELPLLYRGTSAKERKRLAEEALEAVGLKNRMKHYPSQLSGGQKQRVAIARAIVGKPSIILADEPTGNLDSNLGNEVMDILLSLNRDRKATIVMVTHDENMALKTNRIIRLYDGSLVN